MISDDFGIETHGKDKTQMLRDLSDFIISQYARGLRTTLIIDEAQNLSPELLEEVRLLPISKPTNPNFFRSYS